MSEQHIAFKCNYNNGGEGFRVGFAGTCSDEVLKTHIVNGSKGLWCRNGKCECRRYFNKGLKGPRPIDPCYESGLFETWRFGGGSIPIRRTQAGKIAILTTRFPNARESERKVVGLFRISKLSVEGDGHMAYAASKYQVRLPVEEARSLDFWSYYGNGAKPDWRRGLFRYLDDRQVFRLLRDLGQIVQDQSAKQVIDSLLAEDFSHFLHLPIASNPKTTAAISKRLLLGRKYGAGGEGEDHRKLKLYVKEHPDEFGLHASPSMEPELEHRFPSGDLVDVHFNLVGNRFAVVEVETTDAVTGAFQLIKYRALKCAEVGRELSSGSVEALLVAWTVPANVRAFCKKYRMRFCEKRV